MSFDLILWKSSTSPLFHKLTDGWSLARCGHSWPSTWVLFVNKTLNEVLPPLWMCGVHGLWGSPCRELWFIGNCNEFLHTHHFYWGQNSRKMSFYSSSHVSFLIAFKKAMCSNIPSHPRPLSYLPAATQIPSWLLKPRRDLCKLSFTKWTWVQSLLRKIPISFICGLPFISSRTIRPPRWW